MSTQNPQEPCQRGAGYNTAYDALFSPLGRSIPDDSDQWECKKCDRCGQWHLLLKPEQ